MQHIKELVFGQNSREELIKGINTLADAVASTMGAQGRNVIYETTGGLPKSTKDGVTVAKQVFLENALHSLGAELLKEAAENTVNDCGDATTTTVVLAREIIKLANEEVNKGSHPIELKRGIEKATADVLELLNKSKRKLKKSDYFNIANISSNNDRELGKYISDAFKKAGKRGVVLHDKSNSDKTWINVSEGMLIENGYSNKAMITDKSSATMELKNPYVFVCDKEIKNMNEILFLFHFIGDKEKNNENRGLVIIGELSQQVENILSMNRVKNDFPVFYIKAPAFGSRRTDFLEDISIATGAQLMRKDSTDNYKALGLDILGECESIKSTDKETILSPYKERFQEGIDARVKELESLKSQASSTRHKLQKGFLEERIAKLSCSVATILVGANSEVELDEKIDRVDDAVNALRSAVEEGIQLGGGLAMFNVSLSMSRDSKNNTKDFNTGYKIVQEAIKKPMWQILYNTGVQNIDEIIEEVTNSDQENRGYNVSTFEYCDFFKEGIIDPHKATKTALVNASSVASTFLLTDTTISIKRNESNLK